MLRTSTERSLKARQQVADSDGKGASPIGGTGEENRA